MTVNLASALKLWSAIWKSLSHGGPSVLQRSFLCVFILKFESFGFSNILWSFVKAAFHQINYAATFTSNLMSDYKGAFVKDTLKGWASLELFTTWLIDLLKHGWHFPLFKIFSLSKTLLPSIKSPRYLFLLNVNIGGSTRIYFNFGPICKICQFCQLLLWGQVESCYM